MSMQVFDDISALRDYLKAQRSQGKIIGFVPTMGALHEGHLSLVELLKPKVDLVVCSVYVNPAQFNDPEDLAKYPRVVAQDRLMLESQGCDLLFTPTDAQMYPQKPFTNFDFGHLERVMEGQYRPGHFNGVGLVVSKLFHIVEPDLAVFGQKDLQQFLIIQQMTKDLSFNVELICAPIIREADGLAMSSRNRRISAQMRPLAPVFYKALTLAKEKLLSGQSVTAVQQEVREFCQATEAAKLEYFEIVDSQNLKPVEDIQDHQQVSLCIAGYLDGIRLIDNIFLF
jgi:pantoate--beta-alanine ligase